MEIDIGIGKTARQAYGFDDIAIVPSRRTRDPDDVDISWQFDGFKFDLPMLGSAMDGALSPATSIEIGRLGTRRSQPRGPLDPLRRSRSVLRRDRRIAGGQSNSANAGDLPRTCESGPSARTRARTQRSGHRRGGSLTPQKVRELGNEALAGGLDVLVIQGTVVSAEHVSSRVEPLDLAAFIQSVEVPVIVGGCASYSAALHLMRTGAAAVLVGVGPGAACTTRWGPGCGRPASDRDRRCCWGPDQTPRRDRALRTCHRRWRDADRRRRGQGDRLRCGRGDDRLPPRLAPTRLPGRGYHWGWQPSTRPFREGAGSKWAGWVRSRDPDRACPRERWPSQPVWSPASFDGDLRLLRSEGLSKGRNHAGAPSMQTGGRGKA